ncbi:MAG TPA: hypothetical protein VEJ37_00940 [Xanthobacteraceae bacterium]|nr:hypothetical protein [Xanthobacteraceae bacterium]
MRRILVGGLTATMLLCGGLLTLRADALTCPGSATVRGAVRAAIVEQVVNVCGSHGCVPVQTKRVIHHQKPGNTVPGRI